MHRGRKYRRVNPPDLFGGLSPQGWCPAFQWALDCGFTYAGQFLVVPVGTILKPLDLDLRTGTYVWTAKASIGLFEFGCKLTLARVPHNPKALLRYQMVDNTGGLLQVEWMVDGDHMVMQPELWFPYEDPAAASFFPLFESFGYLHFSPVLYWQEPAVT